MPFSGLAAVGKIAKPKVSLVGAMHQIFQGQVLD